MFNKNLNIRQFITESEEIILTKEIYPIINYILKIEIFKTEMIDNELSEIIKKLDLNNKIMVL